MKPQDWDNTDTFKSGRIAGRLDILRWIAKQRIYLPEDLEDAIDKQIELAEGEWNQLLKEKS